MGSAKRMNELIRGAFGYGTLHVEEEPNLEDRRVEERKHHGSANGGEPSPRPAPVLTMNEMLRKGARRGRSW